MIKIQNLTQDFLLPDGSPLRILHEIELTLPSHRTIAIVGQSGSGKSTLLSLLAGLEKPTQGHIEVLGEDLGRLTEEQLSSFRAKHIGFVFQSFQLIPHFDALTNVALALQLAGQEDGGELARAELEKVGLGERLHHLPSRLSGGECQRVAVARALVKRPSLLLCDEPTGNLDTDTAAQVFELLLQAKESHNTAVVIVTHDPELARKCDIRVHLRRGHIISVEGAPHHEG